MIQGNVMVGQSGGPTAVINASLAGVFQGAKNAGVTKVYGMENGIQGLLEGRYVDLDTCLTSEMDIEILKRTPSSFLGSCRYQCPDMEQGKEVYETLFGILNELNVKYLIYIGGNDSMDTVMKLSAYGDAIGSDIRFMGVPKTIDNDLAETDHTPGFGSAAKFVAASVKELICDSRVYRMDAVTIIEVMGRNAGWLTASAALAKGEDCDGADLIYLPERPFDTEDFLARVDALRKEKKTVVIVVSEGLKTASGTYVCEENLQNAAEDAFGHKILNGTADALAAMIRARLGIKARAVTLNTLQRCASHLVSRRDITEAFQAGAEAVHAALNGHTGEMVVFRRISDQPYQMITESYDIRQIANAVKEVPQDWITPDGTNVTEQFLQYCRPLIIGELEPFMIHGLPRHLCLKNTTK